MNLRIERRLSEGGGVLFAFTNDGQRHLLMISFLRFFRSSNTRKHGSGKLSLPAKIRFLVITPESCGNNIAYRKNVFDLSIATHRFFILSRDRFNRVRFMRALVTEITQRVSRNDGNIISKMVFFANF